MRPAHVIAGAGLYLAVAGSTYSWMKSKQSVAKEAGNGDSATATALLGERGPCAAAEATAARFSALSRCYDDTVGSEEKWMLYGLLRSSLLRGKAHGKVLEIGAGTGRNLEHLPLSDVDELTLVDSSAQMLRVAERKYFDEQRLGYKYPHVKARFCLGDAEDLVVGPGGVAQVPPLPPRAEGGRGAEDKEGKEEESSSSSSSSTSDSSGFSRLWRAPASPGAKRRQQAPEEQEEKEAAAVSPPPTPPTPPTPGSQKQQPQQPPPPQQQQKAKFAPASFDVVVDTFGLCSVEDPVRVLRQAARLVKPETGRVLLLEHGRPPEGSLGAWMLSERMDAAAPEHKKRWGCWFNRDIGAIVRESGLKVVSERRWHFGTTYVYELAPPEADVEGDGSVTRGSK
jgi:methyltransferase OMS1